ncbi:Aste57867_23294 [Aphanomyces stellatus]|uniref:Katanin p60 ATPase-containing subunit A1 n=1 Tax=Aphanomyces stellatus TaxID=120398 RepID=A0A485LMI5_9STRA|nr:hypothetical protein As57867_023223 [Aphanomyces stellatus]VFT99939.1 Aste57867_23294 [Aphanomyces stellatus]
MQFRYLREQIRKKAQYTLKKNYILTQDLNFEQGLPRTFTPMDEATFLSALKGKIQTARENCLVGNYDVGCQLFRESMLEAGVYRRTHPPSPLSPIPELLDNIKKEYKAVHRYTYTLDMLRTMKITPRISKPNLRPQQGAPVPQTEAPQKRTPDPPFPSAVAAHVPKRRRKDFNKENNVKLTKKSANAPPTKRVPPQDSKRKRESRSTALNPPKHNYLKRRSISYTDPPASMSGDVSTWSKLLPNLVSARDPMPEISPRTSLESTSSTSEEKKKYSVLAREERWVDLELIEAIERDIVELTANTQFHDIAGLDHVKTLLQEAVMLPRVAPHLFNDGPLKPCNGVLLFGPPGTGKTLLAKALANACQSTFFNVSASTLSSKYRGESEKMVRVLFDMARYYAPSIVFMDEIDAIAGARGAAQEHEASRRVKTELLVQMNGLVSCDDKQVMVLAATNLPWELDEAMRRRLTKRVYIPLPTSESRRALFELNLRKMGLANDIDLGKLAAQTEGYSGDDITNICEAAKLLTVKRVYTSAVLQQMQDKECTDAELVRLKEQSLMVVKDDFNIALENVSKSVSQEHLARFADWETEFGSK